MKYQLTYRDFGGPESKLLEFEKTSDDAAIDHSLDFWREVGGNRGLLKLERLEENGQKVNIKLRIPL